jgi:hypothetical protein
MYGVGIFFLPAASLLLFTESCNPPMSKPAQYIHWVEQEKNGLLQRQETPAFRYTFLLKPKPYLILKSQPAAWKDQSTFSLAEKTLDDLNYASIWLESPDGADLLKKDRPSPEELERRIQYCSFGLQHDLSLVEGPDTLSCLFAHWERMGSIASRQHFILAFEKSRRHSDDDKVFVFKNRMLEAETVRFPIQKNTIDQIPALQF